MTDKILLRLDCGHKLEVDKRPNPRKEWPDPQACVVDEKHRKRRVVEIQYKTPPRTKPLPQPTVKVKKKRASKKKNA